MIEFLSMMHLELAFCSIKIRCHLNILKSRIKHHLGQVYPSTLT
jgi:hypothetical protein